MKPLILSFFTVILIYSLFFDHDEQKEHEYQFGLDSSMNLDKKFRSIIRLIQSAFLLPIIRKCNDWRV